MHTATVKARDREMGMNKPKKKYVRVGKQDCVKQNPKKYLRGPDTTNSDSNSDSGESSDKKETKHTAAGARRNSKI